MDSITHIALGAIAGEAIAGKKLGKRALFLGAIGQSIPDIDFIAAFLLPATENLLVHRGFTHSFVFGALATVVCVALSRRVYRGRNVPLWLWITFWSVEILTHLLIDACNNYGVGWYEPFDHQRFSFHLLFVADIFFFLPLGVGLIALMVMSSKNKSRRFWISIPLALTTAYFVYAMYNKATIKGATEYAIAEQSIKYKRYFATPTPMNTWLWYVVVEDDSGFYTTYRSVFDEGRMAFTYFPQRKELLEGRTGDDDVKNLLRFSQGYYTVEERADTIIFNDLRFGQIAGWADPSARFVFHYYVNYPEANLLVVQRGRFSNWNRRTFRRFVQRIRGD